MIRRGSRAPAIALPLAAILMLAACAGPGAGGSAGGSGVFKIGFTGTLSGEFASYAVEMRQGVELAVDEINAAGGVEGARVEIVVADDRGEPSQGPVVAQRFCDDEDIKVVLGYSFSSVALAAVPVYDRCGLPVLASAVTSPDLSGSSRYFFRNVLTDAVQGAQMGRYAVDVLGFRRIATLHQVDDYGNGVNAAFESAVREAGGEIVSSDGYQLGTKDFRGQLTRIDSVDPDAIFVGGFYPEAAKIAEQARDLGLGQRILGTDGSLSPDLIALGGESVEGMILYGLFHPSLESPEVQRFVSSFEERFGQEPSSWSALAYDAVYAVKAAVELAGGTSRDDVREGLAGVENVPGVTGPTSFNEEGDRITNVLFLTVRDGEFVPAEKQL
ncbi:MAG TPA: ABC transporter substrate-binding protein [Actinomycetota bacterium]|nr:ABC transporter substrate-binding protein [Actinomycetota bacterium]